MHQSVKPSNTFLCGTALFRSGVFAGRNAKRPKRTVLLDVLEERKSGGIGAETGLARGLMQRARLRYKLEYKSNKATGRPSPVEHGLKDGFLARKGRVTMRLTFPEG